MDAVRQVLIDVTRGGAMNPLRQRLDVGPTTFLSKPGAWEAHGVFGGKLVTVCPTNPPAKPLIQGLVPLFRAADGSLAALMPAASITAIRTAAVSGVAAELLAPRDATRAAILGAGVQAATHVEAFLCARPSLRQFAIWARNADACAAFCRDATARHPGVTFTAAGSAAAALAGAEVVATVTASPTPLFDAAAVASLAPGALLCAVGAFTPTTRELPSAALAGAAVYGDSRAGVLAESGTFLLAVADGAIAAGDFTAELGEALAAADGGVAPREGARAVFISLGLAVEDVAAADAALRAAEAAGVGTCWDL